MFMYQLRNKFHLETFSLPNLCRVRGDTFENANFIITVLAEGLSPIKHFMLQALRIAKELTFSLQNRPKKFRMLNEK